MWVWGIGDEVRDGDELSNYFVINFRIRIMKYILENMIIKGIIMEICNI